MKDMVYPDWQTFAYKYRGREEEAFEDLARTLFRKEMGIRYGLFQRVNHKGNETDVVEKDGKVIGFQSKYFKNGIKANDIIDSMKGAKESHPDYIVTLVNDVMIKLGVDESDAYRILFGVEAEEENYLKRPMSKFKNDVMRKIRENYK